MSTKELIQNSMRFVITHLKVFCLVIRPLDGVGGYKSRLARAHRFSGRVVLSYDTHKRVGAWPAE